MTSGRSSTSASEPRPAPSLPADEAEAFRLARRVIRGAPRAAHVIAAEIAGVRNGAEAGGGGGGSISPKAPVDLNALDDAEALYACLAEWALLAADVHASSVRRSPEGAPLGYLGSAGSTAYLELVEDLTDALWQVGSPWRLLCVGDAEGEEAVARIVRRLAKIAASHPSEDRGRYVTTPCTCTGRIVMFPPEDAREEPFIACTDCGRTFTPERLEAVTELAVAVAKVHSRKGRPRVR